jgi:hypothetical protein
MMNRHILILVVLLLVLAACAPGVDQSDAQPTDEVTPTAALPTQTTTDQNGEGQQAELTPNPGSIAQYSAPARVSYIGEVAIHYIFLGSFGQLVSPDGQWFIDYVGDVVHLAIHSVSDPSNIQYVDLSASLNENGYCASLDIIGWSPDSSGFLLAHPSELGVCGPIWYIRIIDGIVQPPLVFTHTQDHRIREILWANSSDRLFVVINFSEEQLLRLYEFTEQLDVSHFYDIPYYEYPPNIFTVFDGNFLSADYIDPDYLLENITIQGANMTRVALGRNDYGPFFCGISPDSQSVMMINSYSPNDPGLVHFNIVNTNSGEIINSFSIHSEEIYQRRLSHFNSFEEFCAQSSDGSLLAFNGNGDSSESGIYVWNWETEELTFWPGEYYVIGWNSQYNGFTVIEAGENGMNTVSVMSVE